MSQKEQNTATKTRQERQQINRRRFMGYFSGSVLGTTLLPGALAAVAGDAEAITKDMVTVAAEIAGLTFTDREIEIR